jgi:hypothetical protein
VNPKRSIHIEQNVFGTAVGTPLQLGLEEGFEDIFKHINLDTPTINNLQYSDSNNNNSITNVRTGDKMLRKCFLSYTGAGHNEGSPIKDDWDQITQADVDSFCIDPKYIIPLTSTQVTNMYGIETEKFATPKL